MGLMLDIAMVARPPDAGHSALTSYPPVFGRIAYFVYSVTARRDEDEGTG
ncbi:hypothetical protein PALU110988_10390 [Paenibacillus lupini]|nr:hypothetical protein [Paenibacillus lupini]